MNNKSSEFIKKEFRSLGLALCEITKSEGWKDRCNFGIQNLIQKILKEFKDNSTIEGGEILNFLRIAYKQGYQSGVTDFCESIPMVMDAERKFDLDKFQTVVKIIDKTKESDIEKIESFVDKLSEGGAL